jgi:hypothetical protein
MNESTSISSGVAAAGAATRRIVPAPQVGHLLLLQEKQENEEEKEVSTSALSFSEASIQTGSCAHSDHLGSSSPPPARPIFPRIEHTIFCWPTPRVNEVQQAASSAAYQLKWDSVARLMFSMHRKFLLGQTWRAWWTIKKEESRKRQFRWNAVAAKWGDARDYFLKKRTLKTLAQRSQTVKGLHMLARVVHRRTWQQWLQRCAHGGKVQVARLPSPLVVPLDFRRDTLRRLAPGSPPAIFVLREREELVIESVSGYGKLLVTLLGSDKSQPPVVSEAVVFDSAAYFWPCLPRPHTELCYRFPYLDISNGGYCFTAGATARSALTPMGTAATGLQVQFSIISTFSLEECILTSSTCSAPPPPRSKDKSCCSGSPLTVHHGAPPAAAGASSITHENSAFEASPSCKEEREESAATEDIPYEWAMETAPVIHHLQRAAEAVHRQPKLTGTEIAADSCPPTSGGSGRTFLAQEPSRALAELLQLQQEEERIADEVLSLDRDLATLSSKLPAIPSNSRILQPTANSVQRQQRDSQRGVLHMKPGHRGPRFKQRRPRWNATVAI